MIFLSLNFSLIILVSLFFFFFHGGRLWFIHGWLSLGFLSCFFCSSSKSPFLPNHPRNPITLTQPNSQIQAALPSLRISNGIILLTSSGASITPYQAWGPYGASKAVLNHLAATLAVEEPAVTTVSIRPGVVDTEMQREIREVHHERMSEGDRGKFKGLKEQGALLRPEQPGRVIARLAVGARREFSGRFLSWNDEMLGAFQEDA